MTVADPGAVAARPPSEARPATRDWRIDVIRGLAMLFVLVDHPRLRSLLDDATEVRLGFISGAEIFVLVSGFVVGTVQRRRCAGGWRVSRDTLWRRARELYVAAAGVGLLTVALTRVPALVTAPVTSNPQNGSTVDPLADRGVLDAVLGVVTLRAVPWPVDVLGLYVLLCLVAPAATWLLLRRGGTAVLLSVSAAGWLVLQVDPGARLPLASETAFPLLAWQALFFLGLVVGWHQDRVRSRLTGRTGVAVVVLAVALEVGFVLLRTSDLRVAVFGRQALDPGRLLNVLVAVLVLYVVLGRLGPATAAVRFALEALGRNSLYVFLVHLPLLVLLHTTRDTLGLTGAGGTLACHVAFVVTMWLLVRHRVGFAVVPR